MAEGVVKELREVISPGGPPVLPRRDVRARRPEARQIALDGARKLARFGTLMALDALGIFLAVFTALESKAVILDERGARQSSDLLWQSASVSLGEALNVAPIAILVTLLLFARSRLYSGRGLRPGSTKVISALFQTTLVIAIYAVVEKGDQYSTYYIFWGSLVFALLYVSVFRWLFERASGSLLRAFGYRRRALLVGTGAQVQAVVHALGGGQSSIDPVGFVSLRDESANGLPWLGSIDALEQHFDSVDEILLADPEFPQARAVELVERCHAHGVRVRVAPSTMEILMDRVEFVPGQMLPLFELKPPVFDGVDFMVKRSFDIVVSALLVLVLSPLLALIALGVRASSRGPIVYRSMRPGIGGEPFACLKFRTMLESAERQQAELEVRNEAPGALFKIRSDPRVTPLGGFLRRFSLDELPQLFNVLRGQMSLVGPRPLPQRDYDRLEDWHRKRYLVLPGMTGLWQVSGRSELDFDELVRLDFLYLERWSVFLDLSILLKTLPAVARSRGAW